MHVKLFQAESITSLEYDINKFLEADFYYDFSVSLSVDNNKFYAIVYYERYDDCPST